jgi:hypothetical protein
VRYEFARVRVSGDGGGAAASPRLPRYAVALVQSELEMLNTPGNELSAFLLSRPDLWHTEVFTERTFEAVLGSTDRFDCVVLGFNAVYQSEAIQDALTDWLPETGLVVLHQLKQRGLSFLPRDLTVALKEVPSRARRAAAREHSDPLDEILLNWPELVGDPDSEAFGEVVSDVTCYLETLQAGIWRTSLELAAGSNRLPVILRTSSTRRSRVCVCTLQLEPRLPEHASLLRNMITYCAAGWPEIAIVDDAGDGASLDVARKLRVQGANAVELPLAKSTTLRFDKWPLRGVHEVIVGEAREPDRLLREKETRRWLQAGNTLVRLERDGLTFHHGASDAHLVGQRWSSWFHSADPVVWHGGNDRDGKAWDGTIFGTRAVLRTLELLRRDETHADAERLGLEAPSAYADPVIALLRKRQGKRGDVSFEGTISTNAAAYDVLQLLGREHADGEIAVSVEGWLRLVFKGAAHEDRFDIARCLRDPELFTEALGKLRGDPLPAVLVTRIREAAVASKAGPHLAAERFEELPSSDLDSNLLLASEYVAGLVAFAEICPEHPAARFDGDGMTRALAAIGKFGILARARGDQKVFDPKRIGPGTISTEARGLIRYYDATPSSTHAMFREAQGVPGGMVEAVLKTANATRKAEMKARADSENVRAELEKREAKLRAVRNGLGVVAVAAALAVFGLTIPVLGYSLPGVAAAFGLGALALVVLSLALYGVDLAPPWVLKAASIVAGGFSNLGSALARLFQTDDKSR